MNRPASLPLVILLHSSGSTGRQWNALAERLRPRARVVAPDLTGHGEGPAWTDDGRDILAADAALAATLARGAGAPVHLVGHSWGGAVALRAARMHPGRFASVTVYEPVLFGLLLAAGGSRRAPAAFVWSIARAMRADLRAGLPWLAARRFVDFWDRPGAFAALSPLRQAAVASRMPAVAAHFAALWNDAGLEEQLARLDVPVQVFVGAQTHAAPRRIAERLVRLLPDVALRTMTAMGHLGPITHPATVAQSMAASVAARFSARTLGAEAA